MPTSNNWPYPLPKGTKVIVKLRGLRGHTEQARPGVVLNSERKEQHGPGYNVRFTESHGGWFASSRVKPIDMNTPEGIAEWLGD